ncbi:MAG TPA: hypothetical protein VG123_32530 [Streptosporangiaceae bacterium]|nr:hypothetical protein [Streptosporangiaceae bacterium]
MTLSAVAGAPGNWRGQALAAAGAWFGSSPDLCQPGHLAGDRARDAGAGQHRHARGSGNGHRFGKPLAAFLQPLAAPGR